jgi:hypothetical protein
MRSSSRLAVVVLALTAHASRAQAERPYPGFAVERLYPSAPGGGWWVMDALDMGGGLGGVLALSAGYASNPLRVTDGTLRLAPVSDQAFTDFGFALTYRRWRFYLNVDVPLFIQGESGTVGGYSITAPVVDLASRPDTVSDPRVGVDVRLVGGPKSRFRFGAGAQLLVPNGNRADFITDGTFRGMVRALFAGDVGRFAWAGHVGVHIRVLDDSPAPGSPHGSELLFGVAGGVKLPVGHGTRLVAIIGPEIFGATAFQSFFGANGTALEALVSARLEGTAEDRLQLRVKLGAGGGLHQRFGAPEWRLVFGVEVFNHNRRPR